VTYTVAVDNTGISTSNRSVTVTDTVPTGLALVPSSAACGTLPNGVTCTVDVTGSTITWTISAGVPAGTTVNLTYQASANQDDQPGTVTNTFSWSGPGCSTASCSTNQVTTDISTMVVTLGVNPPGTVTAGEQLTYTLTAQYNSPAGTPSTGTLVITDSAPQGTTLDTGSPSCGSLSSSTTPTCTVSVDSSTGVITWTIGPGVAGNGSVAVTYAVTTSPQTKSGTTIVNTADYDYSGDDPATNTVATPVVSTAIQGAGGSSSSGGAGGAGSSAGAGGSSSSGGAGGAGSSSGGTSPTAQLTSVVTPLTSTNTVTNVGTGGGTVTAKLAVDPTTPVATGASLDYTVTLTTAGGTVTSPITVTDTAPSLTSVASAAATCGTMPNGVTCVPSVSNGTVSWTITPPAGGLAEGTTLTLQFTATVDSTAGGASLFDAAEITSGPCGTSCASNLVVSKVLLSTTTSSQGNYDVTVVKSVNTAGPVPAGSTTPITYTLTVANGASAPTTALPFTVTDTVPTGTALVSGSVTCGALSATTTPTCSFTVSGSTITWTIGAGLVAGQQDVLGFSVTVLPTTPPGTVKNTATYTSPNCTSSVCSTNTTTTTTTTGGSVQVVKSASTGSVQSGSDLTYTLAVSNTGTGPTQATTLVLDPLPAGTSLVGTPSCPTSLPNGVTCQASTLTYNGTTAVDWQLGPGIPVGGAPIDLTFEVEATGSTSTIVNVGKYSGDGCATGPMCSTNQVTVTVTQPPPIPVQQATFTVTKSASVSSIASGSATPITYTLTATNTSTVSSASSVVITDAIPTGTSYVAGSASCPSGLSATSTPSCTVSYDAATGQVTWTLGSGVAAGASEALSFSVTLNAGTSGGASVVNTAVWTGPGCTTTGGCDTNTVTIPVVVTAPAGTGAWRWTKTASTSSVTAGSGATIRYVLTGTNVGTVATTAPAVVTDTVPAGTVYVPGSATCTGSCTVSYDAATGVITWTVAAGVPAGATVTLGFAVTLSPTAAAGTTITNTARWTGQGCATAGGCTTDTATTGVSAAAPSPRIAGGSGSQPIPGATTVHTGEPWAGASRWAGLVLALGGLLLAAGLVRRRRGVRSAR
jgi:uncharacterized repeat protein (TIGR01451 family)/fimbrial isopeptide formation D2 family protein